MKRLLQTFGNLRIRPKTQSTIMNEENKELEEDNQEYEICILCGKRTSIRRDMPVGLRDYYVHGGGQLCRDCAVSLSSAV